MRSSIIFIFKIHKIQKLHVLYGVSRKAGVKKLSSPVYSKSPSIFIKLIDKNKQFSFEISVYVTKSQCVDQLKLCETMSMHHFDEEQKLWSVDSSPLVFDPRISMGHAILWSLAKNPHKIIQVK